MELNSILRDSADLVWLDVRGQRSWNGTAGVGVAELLLARRRWNVAADQLPSPWSLGAPTGRDICQRESWQLYFLSHLGLSLIHPSCSLSLLTLFFPSPLTSPTWTLLCPVFDPHVLSHPTIPVASVPFPLQYNSGVAPGFLHGSGKLSLPPSSFLFPLSLLHVGVDYALALHMTVLASWAKAWRHAAGQY